MVDSKIQTTNKPRVNNRSTTKSPAVAGDKPRRTDFSDNKWRGYRYVWEVRPDDGWDPAWNNPKTGWFPKKTEKPLLGYVRADSEFNARYAAYDKGLLPLNATFGPEVKKATKFIKDI